jgi:amidohydrolase
MPVMPVIQDYYEELVAIRRDIHAHPEIGFEEVRTSGIVAEKLATWGIEVHRGLGGTGVVGVLRGANPSNRMVGIRAELDALPMDERTGLPFSSTIPGRFHGCGHDVHTTMVLGAARYLAETRKFCGTAVFIFQPAEEGLGGARAMIAGGLFKQFPCDEIYGMHNSMFDEPNKVGIKPGAAMAGADFFDIRVKGHGSHGAMPELSRDPIVATVALVQSLQSIVSRNVSPHKSAVVSVTRIHAGTAYNVLPEEATVSGTIRFLDTEVAEQIRRRMSEIARGVADSFGVEIKIERENVFDVLMNTDDLIPAYAEAARDIVGSDKFYTKTTPTMGSEDFADMLRVTPGVYCTLGHAGKIPAHTPGFIVDEAIIPVGASIFARIVERRLAC